MLYQLYEFNHAAITPWRAAAQWGRLVFNAPANPFAFTLLGRSYAASCELFEALTRRYGKPSFGIDAVSVRGVSVPVSEQIALRLPFGQLKHFQRDLPPATNRRRKPDPTLLIVAPLSGHYATLLRGTVRTMLANHDVYITDWHDARRVPLTSGGFGLNDYTDYIIRFLRHLGPNVHVLAVCQPGPAVLAATALMAEDRDPCRPASLTLMGSPIDARQSPTVPNQLATSRPLSWFEQNVISQVPFPHPGGLRQVYPGFLQLTGFMTMNLDRHVDAHQNLFYNLVEGDGDSVAAHRKFYDEYLAVMDLPAEFYLQTIKEVFQEHALACGLMTHHGRSVNPAAIEDTALMTVEGAKDDISGIGQTQAAHALCANIPTSSKTDYVHPEVGHYGVFNGSRFRRDIAPGISKFIRANRSAR